MSLTTAAIEYGLIGHLLDVSYPPGRLSDSELTGLRDAFDWLLDEHPDVHRRDPRVVEFHQALISESDQRFSLEALLQIPGQLAFDDLADQFDDGVEVPY
jgi:hypothetical protein